MFKDIDEEKYDPRLAHDVFSNRIAPSAENSVEMHARASLGFILSLGLPFSVIFGPPNALVPLARNKTHKGAALPSISHLDFHAGAEKKREKEREIRDSSLL